VTEGEHRVDLVAQLGPSAQLVGIVDDQHGVPSAPGRAAAPRRTGGPGMAIRPMAPVACARRLKGRAPGGVIKPKPVRPTVEGARSDGPKSSAQRLVIGPKESLSPAAGSGPVNTRSRPRWDGLLVGKYAGDC
jgi:hypothetical protein